MNTNQIHLEGNTGTGWQFAGTCRDLNEAKVALQLRQKDYAETDWRIVIGNDENTKRRALLHANAPALLAALEWIVCFCDEHHEWAAEQFDIASSEGEWLESARAVIAQAKGGQS